MDIQRSFAFFFVAAIVSTNFFATAEAQISTGPRPTAASTPSATQPVSSFTYSSQAGDYIGQGVTKTFAAPQSTFQVSGDKKQLRVTILSGSSFSSSSDWWDIELAAPVGDQLRPGIFVEAERSPFRTGRSPGLEVSGNHRGCNRVYGSFAISQIGYDANNQVNMLDASFQQQCENTSAPALKGTIRYKALPLSYSFTSTPGDYIGGGASNNYTNTESLIVLNGTKKGLTLSVSGKRDEWSVRISPPQGQELSVGSYSTSRFADGTKAGLDATGNGRGCNSSSGVLTISSLVTNSKGDVIGLRANFTQFCENRSPNLKGTIRYFQ